MFLLLSTISRCSVRPTSAFPVLHCSNRRWLRPYQYSTATSVLAGRISNAVQDAALLDKTASSNQEQSNRKLCRQPLLDTNPPRGTRDFYPEDMRLRNWLFDQWRMVAKKYGFSEYDAPILENEALYTRKAGEEVTQQLYNFLDKGDRPVSLRPEMTPSLARMVMAKKGGLALPLKWFSIPQCWRYERTTRGRRREHFQWNMDIWGVPGVEADAELLSAMVTFFQDVGLTSEDVAIKVNSRLVIGEILSQVGVPQEKFAATCILVDKLEKVPLESIQNDLGELGLNQTVVKRLTDVLTIKSVETITEILGEESPAVKQIAKLMTLCQAYGIGDWIVFDASIVRGLAYYTGVVFEAVDRNGALRAIAGGGRYDNLLDTFGGDPTPAVGFGFGDAVIVELLKDRGLLPPFDSVGIDTVVFAMDASLYPAALKIATALRQAGQTVDLILEERKTKWVLKHTDRLGAKYCAIVGSREFENGEVAIKDLAVGEQRNVSIHGLDEWVKGLTQ